MRNVNLFELEQSLQPYLHLWNEWSNSKACSLTEDEIYTISSLRNINYRISTEGVNVNLFHQKAEFFTTLHQKLIKDYPKYQAWVIVRFHSLLVYVGLHFNPGQSFTADIQPLNISKNLKDSLLQFNIKTLNGFFIPENEKKYKAIGTFEKVCSVIKCAGAESKKKTHRREVPLK